jgi:aryl-alcohol dehydrogenase-like predicted oxidoreductase
LQIQGTLDQSWPELPAITELREIRENMGRALAGVVLTGKYAPILGARKIGQLRDNIASLEVSLTPEQVALLDEASKTDAGTKKVTIVSPKIASPF